MRNTLKKNSKDLGSTLPVRIFRANTLLIKYISCSYFEKILGERCLPEFLGQILYSFSTDLVAILKGFLNKVKHHWLHEHCFGIVEIENKD